jgi:hypothetical protein
MKANKAPESYPMQFRDKIDEYLWKEHHILGGCCSSVESLKYSIAREVAEKLTDAFIEKAEKWLNEHILDYVYAKEWGQGVGVEGELFNDFKEYMKGE